MAADDGVLYRLYEKRLQRELASLPLPHHIGVIVDGNRRWAKETGGSTADGHRRGGEKILELLSWCEEVDIRLVTVWLLSVDNLKRPAAELEALFGIIVDTVGRIADAGYAVRLAGNSDILPERVRQDVQQAIEGKDVRRSVSVNVAIGYGGREEIVRAVQELVRDLHQKGLSGEDLVQQISAESIADHLYTRGQPDPDLIIRTSGEQRLSGFLLWQSVHSEFWFTETHWPGFRRVDFLRALREYAKRDRRFGK